MSGLPVFHLCQDLLCFTSVRALFHQCQVSCVPPVSGLTVFHQCQGSVPPVSGLTVFHLCQDLLCSTRVRDKCVPPVSGLTVFQLRQGLMCSTSVRAYLLHQSQGCVLSVTGRAVFHQCQGFLCSISVRAFCVPPVSALNGSTCVRIYCVPPESTRVTRARAYLLNHSPGCVPPETGFYVFHQRQGFLCSTSVRD